MSKSDDLSGNLDEAIKGVEKIQKEKVLRKTHA